MADIHDDPQFLLDLDRAEAWIEQVLDMEVPKVDDLTQRVMGIIGCLGFIFGTKHAGDLQKNQPHLTVEEIRPMVLLSDVLSDARTCLIAAGVRESTCWFFFQTYFYYKVILHALEHYIPEENHNQIDEDAVKEWANTYFSDFIITADDTEEE